MSLLVVSETVRVPVSAITVRASRVDLDAIEGLSDAARRRLVGLASGRLAGAGRLVVTSPITRAQSRNLEDARARVRDLIAAALIPPRARRATRPSRTSRERRIAGKKFRGATKRLRAKPGDWS